jgi:N-acetylglutamate synthase-like GNAT family acetyltransferase
MTGQGTKIVSILEHELNMRAGIIICETDELAPLVRFFMENDLEFESEDDYSYDEIRKAWRADDGGKLVGGCVLARREGRFICDGIATDVSVRGAHLGEALLKLLLDEVRSQGGAEVYLVARAPGFFAKYGFEVVRRDDAPTFFECFTCPQYGVSCHPEVMRKTL